MRMSRIAESKRRKRTEMKSKTLLRCERKKMKRLMKNEMRERLRRKEVEGGDARWGKNERVKCGSSRVQYSYVV